MDTTGSLSDSSTSITETSESDDSLSASNTTQSEAFESKETEPSGVSSGAATPVNPTSVAAYSGKAYAVINDNQPNFSATELSTAGYEKYSELDSLGRRRDWGEIHSQLEIFFADRLPQ